MPESPSQSAAWHVHGQDVLATVRVARPSSPWLVQ
uniref:Uncharacterized protein n=1 Tax=Anguilla anguilla TaxID=7936 RepID=A0A0E9PIU4_ANGAN